MLQGARTKEDVGQAVIFCSEDKVNWTFRSRVETDEKFGYMWECRIILRQTAEKSSQPPCRGWTGEEWKDRNVYQSGYFLVDGDVLGEYSLSELPALGLWL